MKTVFFLIIIGLIEFVISCDPTNVFENDSLHECPIALFRRKRANVEYTRWRSDANSGTSEFIVKVLEDDFPTSNTKQVIAVNIQPVTKRGEKIIIGGAMVPMQTSAAVDVTPREYTRFVPPTTAAITQEGDLFLAPVHLDNIEPVKPKGAVKHALRDESPPVSPQFLARSPSAAARQYAPVALVTFTRTSLMPITPPDQDYSRKLSFPTRSSQMPDIFLPSRTIPMNFPIYEAFEVDDKNTHDIIVPRTTMRTSLYRTTLYRTEQTLNTDEMDIDMIPTTKNTDTDDHHESDSEYHSFFDNDDYRDSNISRNGEGESNYEDKNKWHEENDSLERDFEQGEILTDYATSVNKNTTDVNPEADNDTFRRVTKTTMKANIVASKSLPDRIDKDKDLKRQPVCSIRKLRQLNFNSPRTLAEIFAQLKQWAEESPLARWVDITEGNLTTMENPIYLMIVDDPSSGQIASAKQTVMVVAGIQGRDHHAVAAALYVLYQLIERSAFHADLLAKYRFWIIPVFNPDGYDYSMTFPHRREWSKNLRQSWVSCKGRESCAACEKHGLRCTIQPCYGVNLDRNFEYQWISPEELRAEHPCGSLYAGARQFSEAETRALSRHLHRPHVHDTQLYYFVAFKEGDVLGIMYPYSHTRKSRHQEHIYRSRASRAASAAYSIGGRPYVAGQTSQFLPLYAGGIEDWVEGHLGIDNTYTVMMFQPSDSVNSKLITERVVHEAYAALDTLLLQDNNPQTVILTKSATLRALPSLNAIALARIVTYFCR